MSPVVKCILKNKLSTHFTKLNNQFDCNYFVFINITSCMVFVVIPQGWEIQMKALPTITMQYNLVHKW